MNAKQNPVVQLPMQLPRQEISKFLTYQVGKLVVRYYTNRVSVSCRYEQRSYGAAAKTLPDALIILNQYIDERKACLVN